MLLFICFSFLTTLFFVLSNRQFDYQDVYNTAAKKIQNTFQLDDNTSASASQDAIDAPATENNIPGLINSTLGFQKVMFLSNSLLYDLSDITSMQSSISGIAIDSFDSVSPENLNTHGLPPDSLHVLSRYEQARFRSHANLWREMLNQDWTTLLILEADSTWDVNIRRLMMLFSNGLQEFMRKQGKYSEVEENANDPYVFANWDVLQLGGCLPNRRNAHLSYPYYDPYVPSSLEFYGVTVPPKHRVVRYQSPERCANAYAVSRSGAMKLLLATAVDMSTPIDVMMRTLTIEGRLDVYSTFPALFGRWEYLSELKHSDGRPPTDLPQDERKKIWEQVYKNFNVWKSGGTSTAEGDDKDTGSYVSSMLDQIKSYIYGTRPNLFSILENEAPRNDFDGEVDNKNIENAAAPGNNDDGSWVIPQLTDEQLVGEDKIGADWVHSDDQAIAAKKEAEAKKAAEAAASSKSAAEAAQATQTAVAQAKPTVDQKAEDDKKAAATLENSAETKTEAKAEDKKAQDDKKAAATLENSAEKKQEKDNAAADAPPSAEVVQEKAKEEAVPEVLGDTPEEDLTKTGGAKAEGAPATPAKK